MASSSKYASVLGAAAARRSCRRLCILYFVSNRNTMNSEEGRTRADCRAQIIIIRRAALLASKKVFKFGRAAALHMPCIWKCAIAHVCMCVAMFIHTHTHAYVFYSFTKCTHSGLWNFKNVALIATWLWPGPARADRTRPVCMRTQYLRDRIRIMVQCERKRRSHLSVCICIKTELTEWVVSRIVFMCVCVCVVVRARDSNIYTKI